MIPSWTTEFPCCLLWFITKKWRILTFKQGPFFDRGTTQMLQRWMQPTKSEDFKSSASTVFPPKSLHVAEIRPEWTSPRVRVVMCPALPWISCYAEATFDCQRIGPHSCGDHQETGGEMTPTLPWKRAKWKTLWWKGWRWLDDNGWLQHMTEIFLDASHRCTFYANLYINDVKYMCLEGQRVNTFNSSVRVFLLPEKYIFYSIFY